MTNVTVQEALKAAIFAIESNSNGFGLSETQCKLTLDQCKAALAEIEKCEPVGELILDPVFLPALKAPLVNWKINLVDLEVGTKFFTSPQPRECEDWQYFDKAYRKAAETSDATDWMNAALLAQQVRRKQLNTKG